MIKLQDTIIQASTEDVINTLRFDLAQKGLNRFAVVRPNGENLQSNCPFHKNGQERKPSFGVNGEIDKCHCFSCGWAGTIEEMISELYGYQDEGKFGKRWLIKRFNTVEIETRPNIMEGFNGRNTGNNRNTFNDSSNRVSGIQSDRHFITEEELDKYRYIHPYMYERKMDDRVIEIFDVGYDKETECITFPIRDKNGNCLFIARRSVNTKFFSYPQGVEKPLYGLYELYQLDEFPKEIYICESMIDAITIWTHCDKYAVALNGLGNDLQFSQLNNMPNRTFILATDNDSAGIKARIRLKKYITNKIIKEIILPSNRKDINECTYNEFENIKITF
nr:MAG TPA: DNA directed DNA polymerase [Caudoviricetes sp.]